MVDPAGKWSCQPALPMSDGDYTLRALQTSPAGRSSGASAPAPLSLRTLVAPTFTQPQASWPDSQSASREEYERELKVRQAEHLRNIAKNKAPKWVPCLHDVCPHCLGTGQKIDGSPCVHNLDCTCPKCENVRMAP